MPANNQRKYGFPKSQILEATRDVGSFVLIADDGRVWSSAPDDRSAAEMVHKSGLVQETTG